MAREEPHVRRDDPSRVARLGQSRDIFQQGSVQIQKLIQGLQIKDGAHILELLDLASACTTLNVEVSRRPRELAQVQRERDTASGLFSRAVRLMLALPLPREDKHALLIKLETILDANEELQAALTRELGFARPADTAGKERH